jgi:hypothetical protein
MEHASTATPLDERAALPVKITSPGGHRRICLTVNAGRSSDVSQLGVD